MSAVVESLLARKPSPALSPNGVWQRKWAAEIASSKFSVYVRAALHLLNDDLEAAHLIAQEHENPHGHYVHAIVHRREKDFSNARYWLKRVGEHPAYAAVKTQFPEWTPEKFVGWCEHPGQKEEPWLVTVQAFELANLLEYFRAQK